MLIHPLLQTFDREPVPYLDALAEIYAAMDRAYHRAADHYGFKCTGCADNCCYTHFYHYTYLEYCFVYAGYRGLDERQRAEIRKRAGTALGVGKAVAQKDKDGRHLCPLNFDGRCILYAHRPMICRLHGIPHEFRTIDRKIISAPGCDAFTVKHGDMAYYPFDRTPFYTRMARLENELKRALGVAAKLKMTIAEMVATFWIS